MTTLKVQQIKSLKEKFNRLMKEKAPLNDIKRLSKYIIKVDYNYNLIFVYDFICEKNFRRDFG